MQRGTCRLGGLMWVGQLHARTRGNIGSLIHSHNHYDTYYNPSRNPRLMVETFGRDCIPACEQTRGKYVLYCQVGDPSSKLIIAEPRVKARLYWYDISSWPCMIPSLHHQFSRVQSLPLVDLLLQTLPLSTRYATECGSSCWILRRLEQNAWAVDSTCRVYRRQYPCLHLTISSNSNLVKTAVCRMAVYYCVYIRVPSRESHM